MKTNLNHTDAFLPELGISIFELEIDVEQLDAETAMRYWLLAQEYLTKNARNSDEYEIYAYMKPNFIEPTWDDKVYINFDVYDLLPGMLADLRERFPYKTEKQIIHELEHKANLELDTF